MLLLPVFEFYLKLVESDSGLGELFGLLLENVLELDVAAEDGVA